MPESRPSDFNLLFDVDSNELNTFNGTYTKRLGIDPSVTIEFPLTDEEMDRIYEKMVAIDFFCYPDEFKIPFADGSIVQSKSDPHKYYFMVQYDDTVKEVNWNDTVYEMDEDARNLGRLAGLIQSIIESKTEYWDLPWPSGGEV